MGNSEFLEITKESQVRSRSVHLHPPWGLLILDAYNMASTIPTGIAEVVRIERKHQGGPLPVIWVGGETEIDVEHRGFQIFGERLYRRSLSRNAARYMSRTYGLE